AICLSIYFHITIGDRIRISRYFVDEIAEILRLTTCNESFCESILRMEVEVPCMPARRNIIPRSKSRNGNIKNNNPGHFVRVKPTVSVGYHAADIVANN